MPRCAVFIQGQSERGLRGDERGVSPVVGAILVIFLFSIGITVYVTQVVPALERKNESKHMLEVRDAWKDLQSAVLATNSCTIGLQMAPESTPLFSFTQNPTTIEVTPARQVIRLPPDENAYVDEGGNPLDNYLWVRSDDTGNNRRTYLRFGITDELENVYPGDIYRAWLVLYCENLSKFPWAPWGMDLSDLPVDELPDLPISVEIREVGNNDWDGSTISWGNQPEDDIYSRPTIMALDWPNEDNQTISDNETWYTWGVTTWVREQLERGENVSFCLMATRENATVNRYAKFSSMMRDPWKWPHLTVIYKTSSPTEPILSGDDPWGPFIEGGTAKVETDYWNFPSYSFTFESGALIQQQWGYAYELMIANPGVITGQRVPDTDYIVAGVNHYRIINHDRLSTTADAKVHITVRENTDYRIEPQDTDGDGDLDPNRDNVLVTIFTESEWQWKYYLRDLKYQMNSYYAEGGLKDYMVWLELRYRCESRDDRFKVWIWDWDYNEWDYQGLLYHDNWTYRKFKLEFDHVNYDDQIYVLFTDVDNTATTDLHIDYLRFNYGQSYVGSKEDETDNPERAGTVIDFENMQAAHDNKYAILRENAGNDNMDIWMTIYDADTMPDVVEAKYWTPRNVRFLIRGRMAEPGENDIYYYERTYDVEIDPAVE